MLEIRVGYAHLLRTLNRLEARPTGFYTVLFSTTQTTHEQALNTFVTDNWQQLDTLMASAESACFAVADAVDLATRQDVYVVARELGIPFEVVPAMAFFVEPDDLRRVMYVGLGDLLKHDAGEDRLWELFRGIAGAMVRATDEAAAAAPRFSFRRGAANEGDRRMAALRAEWQRASARGQHDMLARVTTTTGQLAETASSGRTIVEALAAAAAAVGMAI